MDSDFASPEGAQFEEGHLGVVRDDTPAAPTCTGPFSNAHDCPVHRPTEAEWQDLGRPTDEADR